MLLIVIELYITEFNLCLKIKNTTYVSCLNYRF